MHCSTLLFDSENCMRFEIPIALHRVSSFETCFLKMDKMH